MKKLQNNCWPTKSAVLLLKAGFLPPKKALSYWNRYCKKYDLQKVSYVETNLFSLVYKNLSSVSEKIRDSRQMQTCKSQYRYVWTDTQTRFYSASKVIQLLSKHRIETCLLKGAALCVAYYKDMGLRVMGDVDLWVPPSKIHQAYELLLKEGWYLKPPYTEAEYFKMHALQLLHPSGGNIDLHFYIFSEFFCQDALKNFAFQKCPVSFFSSEIKTQVFCPEDLLIHIFYHGLKWSPVPLIRWVPDAVMVLKSSPHFRWDYFFEKMIALDIVALCQQGLSFLKKEKLIVVSKGIYAALMKHSVSINEKRRISLYHNHKHSLFDYVDEMMDRHIIQMGTRNKAKLVLTLPLYFKRKYGFRYFHQVVFHVVKKSVRALRGKAL